MQDEAKFWPYTYMDSKFNKAYILGGEGYCSGGIEGVHGCGGCQRDCEEKWRDTWGYTREEFVGNLDDIKAALVAYVS